MARCDYACHGAGQCHYAWGHEGKCSFERDMVYAAAELDAARKETFSATRDACAKFLEMAADECQHAIGRSAGYAIDKAISDHVNSCSRDELRAQERRIRALTLAGLPKEKP